MHLSISLLVPNTESNGLSDAASGGEDSADSDDDDKEEDGEGQVSTSGWDAVPKENTEDKRVTKGTESQDQDCVECSAVSGSEHDAEGSEDSDSDTFDSGSAHPHIPGFERMSKQVSFEVM